MIQQILTAAAVATTLLLAGCSTPDLTGRPFFDTLEAPRADQATLYFYRVMPTIAPRVPASITINGKAAGELLGGSYFVAHLPAGKYHIKSSTSPLLASKDNNAFDLQVENGKLYFIADQEDTEPFKADGQMLGTASSELYRPTTFYFRHALVLQDEAMRGLKWCQQSSPVVD